MKKALVYKKNECRVCQKNNLTKVLTFGPTPLANAFLNKDQINKEEYFFPLDVYFCEDCGFLGLGHIVNSEVLFGDYVYVSSTSKVFVKHFNDFAKHTYNKLKLTKRSLVIDIGSNDGVLLKPFKEIGTRVLGIEPAEHIAQMAKKEGINTIPEYFSVDLAKRIVKKYGNANVVTATNVFAHIDDLDDVIKGLKILLEKDGVFIIEAPYLVDFIKKRYFDLVYHEHMSYWAIDSLSKLFDRFDMEVFHVEKVPVHGGTVRVYVQKKESKRKIEHSVSKFLKLENKNGLREKKTYLEYSEKIQENKLKLTSMLSKLKANGKTIAAYGAPAKGNTLLNYFSIGNDILDFVVDDSPLKQNLYTPGKHIPIVSSKELYKRKPDYLLILAWNFANPIMETHKEYKKQGGKFIVPVPKPKIF